MIRTADGRYFWTYRLSLKKNPVVFSTLGKALAFLYIIPFIAIIINLLREGRIQALNDLFVPYLLFGLLILSIVALVYFLEGLALGWHYIFLYEMDEEGVSFRFYYQTEISEEEMKDVTFNEGDRSVFKNVYKIKAYPERDLIKVNSFLLFNQIYADPDIYPFVREFIETHTGKTA